MDNHVKTQGARKSGRRRSPVDFRLFAAIAVVLAAAFLAVYTAFLVTASIKQTPPASSSEPPLAEAFSDKMVGASDLSKYPDELIELFEKNHETIDFIRTYADRVSLREAPVDISADVSPYTVPLFIQWDSRWGWNYYGDDLIAVAGCGPTCLSMAYVYLSGNTSMNPRAMAEYAYRNGYYSSAGTKWSLWTEGTSRLGLTGYEIPLSESAMKNQLDNGGLIICSMSPGDFTTTGHFILIRGYDKNGFYVNDPNSRERSSRQWSYSVLSHQIKGIWGISK